MFHKMSNILSDSENAEIAKKHLLKVIEFVRSEVSLDVFVNRFGYLSNLINHVPVYLYDNKEMEKEYPTAFTDGQSIWFSLSFWEKMRNNEVEINEQTGEKVFKGHNIVPVILHELSHIAYKHTEREALNNVVKTPFEDSMMNMSMDSFINGYIYNSFSKFGVDKFYADTNTFYPELELGEGFLTTAIGYNDEDVNYILKDRIEKKTDEQKKEDYLKSVPQEFKKIYEKQYDMFKEFQEALHWKKTLGEKKNELIVFRELQEIKNKYQDELKDLIDKVNQQGQSSKGQNSKGQNSKGGKGQLDDIAKKVAESLGMDDSDNHIISQEKLKEVLKKAGVSEEEIKKVGVSDKASEVFNDDRIKTAIDSSIASDNKKSLESSFFTPGKALTNAMYSRSKASKKDIPSSDFCFLRVEDELGNSEIDVLTDSLDEELLSLGYDEEIMSELGLEAGYDIVAEETSFSATKKGRLICLLDTSGSVSDDEIARFLGSIEEMFTTLEEQGSEAEIYIIQADTIIHEDTIVKVNAENIDNLKDFLISGRGGTSFENALYQIGEIIRIKEERAEEIGGEFSVDHLLFFTDGEDTAPTEKPHENLPENISYIVTSKTSFLNLENTVQDYADLYVLAEDTELKIGQKKDDDMEMSMGMSF